MAAFRKSVAAAIIPLAILALFIERPQPGAGATRAPAAAPSFTLFESGQVRPLALSPTAASSSPATRPTTAWRCSG